MAKATKETGSATPEEKVALLEAKIKEQEAAIVELNEINVQLQNTIEEQEILLSKKGDKSLPAVKEKKKASIPSKSFKVDGEDHVFVVPQFTNPLDGHAVITAEEALTNKDLLEHLVKNNTGITKRKGS